MKYFFILGNNTGLSVAEILAAFPNKQTYELINKDVFVVEIEQNLSGEIIEKLGGTIKFGLIEAESEEKDLLGNMLSMIDLGDIKGKLNFGISVYGSKIPTNPLGMEIKNYIKEAGLSARYVISREPVLSSVVVEQNKLVDSGIEYVLFPVLKEGQRSFMIGRTLAVQPFKALSYRDYGRPGRDDRSGMLPPKLAQIMINLSGCNKEEIPPTPLYAKGEKPPYPPFEMGVILLDPFCGSGTVLTEAMLMGFDNIIGSDASERAVSDTKKNINWIKEKFDVRDVKSKLHNLSATELSREIETNSIDIIVTEPYLGPQRGHVDIRSTIKELEDLYSKSLVQFYKVLKPKGRVVMIWPVTQGQNGKYSMNPDIGKFKQICIIPDDLKENKLIKLTERGTIVYGRDGQKVWREIVVLEKI